MLSCFILASSGDGNGFGRYPGGWATRRSLLRYAVAAGLAVAVVIPVTQSLRPLKTGPAKGGNCQYITQNHDQPVTDPLQRALSSIIC